MLTLRTEARELARRLVESGTEYLLFTGCGSSYRGAQFGAFLLGAERAINPDTLRTDDLDHARAWLTAFPFGSH